MKKILLSTIALMMSVAMMAIGLGDGSSKANALDFDWTTDNVHDATEALWYNVSLAPVNAANEPAVVLYLTNLTDEEATVNVTVSIASAQRTVTYTIAARDYYRLDIPVDQYREFITLDEISLMIKSNVKLSLGAKVYEFDEYVKEAIANSEPIDWNTGVQQDALSTKWYDVDITSLKTNKEHLQVTFTNKAKKQALVSATFVFEGKHVSLPLPIPAGFTTTKVIDYQLLSKLPARVSRIHVGVTTDSPLEVATSTFSAIASDPTPCLNAINPVHGQAYTHEAGATKWYKISMDLLKSQSATSSVYLANKSNKKAHVTIGLVPDCQYTTGTKVTLPLPAGFELGALAPNMLGRLVEELQRFETTYNEWDAKDVYLEVHSDQTLEFGLDVNNAITNPCLREDLQAFDWNNGVQVEADKAAWYDVDITTIKNAGKHVKLTFTNPTKSIVWVATVVSVNCPAELTVPMIVPVPAGMSVDHVIDYSIFAAADVDHLYVGVKAEDALKLTAKTIDADASASNQADCNAATKVESGKTYTHKAGAHWYQFQMSLLDNMGDAARVTFKNKGAKTAKLSAGVTVDCQYGIVNRVPVKVPHGVDMSLSVPARVINKVREWIDADVANFYLHLDSDQELTFGVDMDAVSVTACSSAVDFDWQAWEANGLQIQANQDVWYKVNLDYPLEKLEKGEDIVVSLSNLANDMDVEVEIAVSPTCPALLSLEKIVTIPANEKLTKEFSHKEVMALLDQYNKYVYDSESEKLLGHYDTYVFFNKLEKLLGRYGKYVPFGQVDMLLKRYGAHLTVSGIIDMIENYEQYITIESLKKQLVAHKEYVSYEQLMGLLDQYGEYIPNAKAQQLLEQYGEYIPYLGGGAVMLLDQCEKYFTTDDLQKVVNKLKQHLPIDELKQLFTRFKKYLPEDNTCYVNVKSKGDLVVEEDTIPETPEGCWAAVELDYTKTYNLSELPTGWYKVGLDEIRAAQTDLELNLNNDLGADTIVTISAYKSCDDVKPLVTRARKMNVGLNTETIPYALIKQYASSIDTLYLYLVNNVQLCGQLSCESAVPFPLNTTVTIDKEAWYTINVDDLLAVDTLIATVRNTTDLTVSANIEVSLVCPIDEDVVVLVKDFVAGYEKKSAMTAAQIQQEMDQYGAYPGDVIYMHICPVGALELTLNTVNEPETEPCLEAEYILWNDSIHLDANTDKWYKVDVQTAVESDKDLELIVINGDVENHVFVEYGVECPSDDWTQKTFVLAANQKDTAIITQNDLDQAGAVNYVYVHITTTGEVSADADFKDEPCYEYKTITGSVCDGDTYVDPITGKGHVISSLIASSQTWNDTVVTGLTCDSIYTFVITPTVAPQVMTEDLLATIPGAMPTLKPGCTVDVAGTIEAIKAYYELNDTEAIADVVNVEWTAGADAELACDATEHTMTLKVEAGCDFVINTTIKLTVEPINVFDAGTTDAEVCEGESYTWAVNGVIYTPTKDTTVVEVKKNDCGCEVEKYTLNLTIKTRPAGTTMYAEVCPGTKYTEWEKNPSGEYGVGTHYFPLEADAACDEAIDTLIVTEKTRPAGTTMYAEVCPGTKYTGWEKNPSGEYGVGTHYFPLESDVDCDVAIDTLVVTEFLAPEDVVEYDTICPGETITWNGETFATAGEHTLTLQNENGCAYQATLHLYVADADNVPEYDNLDAVGKYGDRLLLLNLNRLNELATAGTIPAVPSAGNVTWYRVNGERDLIADILNGRGDDEAMPNSNSYYYNNADGSPLMAGNYYVLMNLPGEEGECPTYLRSVEVELGKSASLAPQLVPTIAEPNAELHILNLNPSNVTEVRVFNTSGELIENYTASEASEFVFKAATMQGYYMVEVQSENDKVTLRYIVK